VTYQRQMRFTPTAFVDAIPQLVTVICAYPLGIYLQDYRVMLVLVLLQPAAYSLLSHFFAVRPYRWLIQKDLIKKKVHFAWPLLINGFLMFAIFNGDKAIVGHSYSMEVLGWYGAVFALALTPTLLFAKVCTTILLPVLSKSFGEDNEQFKISCAQATGFCIGVACFTFLFFVVSGSAVVLLCYGDRYIEGARVVILLALMQSLRITRIAPTIIAISYSDTKNAMYSNIIRVLSIPVAIYLALNNYQIEWIVIAGVAGEILALVISVSLLKPMVSKFLYLKNIFIHCGLFILLGVSVFLIVNTFDQPDNTFWSLCLRIIYGFFVSLFGLSLHLLVDTRLRNFVLNHAKKAF